LDERKLNKVLRTSASPGEKTAGLTDHVAFSTVR